MTLRRSTLCLTLLSGLVLVLAGLFLHAAAHAGSRLHEAETASLVRRLSLSDLCVFTEASYTRHLGTADTATAFQESPLSLEHFPTGSLAAPRGGNR